MLFDAFPRIAWFFGTAAQVTLDVVSDPEAEPQRSFLTAVISTELDPLDALARRDKFDEAWWREVGRKHPRLIIDVD